MTREEQIERVRRTLAPAAFGIPDEQGFVLMAERIVDALADELEQAARLRAAIVEHRAAVRAAGDVRVDSLDVPRAQAKRLADARLWRVIDEHV